MSEYRVDIHRGVPVVDSDGRGVGIVAGVREDDFLVHRPEACGIYIPKDAVARVESDRVVLTPDVTGIELESWPREVGWPISAGAGGADDQAMLLGRDGGPLSPRRAAPVSAKPGMRPSWMSPMSPMSRHEHTTRNEVAEGTVHGQDDIREQGA